MKEVATNADVEKVQNTIIKWLIVTILSGVMATAAVAAVLEDIL